MMLLSYFTLFVALTLSTVAAYYSIVGLTAIFAASIVPIIIMGSVLEVAKITTTVWLHEYWDKCRLLMKIYLVPAVALLMFITSMGIFGFLSKAHIEQTAQGEESIAQVERLTTEIARQSGIVERSEQRIKDLQANGVGADANIQSQIDREQERIDRAFERIQPAIAQQNKIIDDARANDNTRTKPYEDQLANIQAEILRLETSAKEYETTISNLEVDSSTVDPLLAQIAALEEEIIRVTNQLNSGEQQQIRAGQAIIGVTNDGLFGSNTRTALANWVSGQRDRITQIQGEISQVRRDAQGDVNAERERLAGVVSDIRQTQIPALKDRELDMLSRIDEVRQTESPAIATARDEIQRLRRSAEDQVANSQTLIERLRSQLAQEDKAQEIELAIDEQSTRITEANAEIDKLTEEKYALEAEYRKLEAEVGPVKYIAEFIYGDDPDANVLERAVRWVIIVLVVVFDPLAITMVLASTESMKWERGIRSQRRNEEDDGTEDNNRITVKESTGEPATGTDDNGRDLTEGMAVAEEEKDVLDDTHNANNAISKSSDNGPDVEHQSRTPVQDGDVEHNERDREADDAESLSRRSDVESAEEQVPNSDQTQEGTSTEQDTGRSTGKIPDSIPETQEDLKKKK